MTKMINLTRFNTERIFLCLELFCLGLFSKWWRTQTLYWQGVEIARSSEEYQVLLDRAFDALAQNSGFRAALLATGNSVLTHSIGKTKITETVLTRQEFCSRLTKIREELRKEN